MIDQNQEVSHQDHLPWTITMVAGPTVRMAIDLGLGSWIVLHYLEEEAVVPRMWILIFLATAPTPFAETIAEDTTNVMIRENGDFTIGIVSETGQITMTGVVVEGRGVAVAVLYGIERESVGIGIRSIEKGRGNASGRCIVVNQRKCAAVMEPYLGGEWSWPVYYCLLDSGRSLD